MNREELISLLDEVREEIRIFERPSVDNSKKMLELLTEVVVAHPLPPAEGTEEILDKYPHSIEYPSFVHENSAIAAMQEFTTLHAQRIADKMVSERLREEYKRGIEDGKIIGEHGSLSYIE